MGGGGPARPRAPDRGRTGDRAAPGRFRDRAYAVHRLARRLQRLRHRRGLAFRDHHGHADAAVEGARHLLRLDIALRSEEHTSELQSLMRISYAVFCLKQKNTMINTTHKS